MTTQLAKAHVEILEGRNAGEQVEVLFNPSEYAVEYGVSFQETAVPGLSNPILQFVNGAAEVLSMDLLFDTYTDGGGADVSEVTANFIKMLTIDGETHAPPRVLFKWGVFSFRAIVEKISQRFTMFLGDGTPVRATLQVTFKQYRTVREQLENPRRNSADKTKHRVLGKVDSYRSTPDSLWLLSSIEYGEPRFWRDIARQNDVEDLRALAPGDVMVVPPLEDFKPKGGSDGR
ncbi:peptidoglycan-binding LysM [Rhodobacteraceae bacterium KLH11]|nr:peptidoglycan-binding LysM [Rhodobacteraceae bacterium KLH11]